MPDIGDYRRLSDLERTINQSLLQLPSARKLVNNVSKKYPFVFFEDEAFPLRCNLLKPFSRIALELACLIFNDRLSRARHIVKNAFGTATSRSRVFRRSICAKAETGINITKVLIILHNF